MQQWSFMSFLWFEMNENFSLGIGKDYEVRVTDGNISVLF